ncbi:MAG: ribonuclease D [Woeseia sp.]
MSKLQFIDLDSPDAISTLLPKGRLIGVDTEFMREKTFYPQLCLVQIAADDGVYCADPLDAGAIDMFWQQMMRCNWVVHSARQDIEVLFHTSNLMPGTLFDTQIGAALLGFAPQLGYAGLVEELFDVQLAKSHTRTDWTQRPLPAAALEYAAEDVQFLLPAYEVLAERLAANGRLAWAEEDSASLLNPVLYKGDSCHAVSRLRGARNLRGRARAAAARLASWREREAERRDRPRQWIMKDAVLLEIASSGPEDREALSAIPGLAPRTLRRAADILLKTVAAARDDAVDYEPPRKPDEKQKSILKDMQAAVSACADELGIAGEIIAPRRELAASLNGERASRVFTGWRRELIGEQLLQMLARH